jgi:hypothetical protein
MLIIALVLALIGLVALVFAIVTSNELVAWVCIGASVLGVVLLIVDALRERQGRDVVALENDEASDEESGEDSESADEAGDDAATFVDYPEEVADEGDQEPKSSEEVASTDASEESAVPADGTGEDSAK